MQRLFSTEADNHGAHRRHARARAAGFTLIEVMIVVAIVAILAAIAYPAYTSHIIKTRRVAAEGCMSEFASYMERYYTTNLRYDQDATGTANTLPELDCKSAAQTGNNYQYRLSTLEKSKYKIDAIPQDGQADQDTECGTLSLDQTGERTVSGDGGVAKCW